MNKTEQWLLVPGWEDYECSNLGQIRRATKSRTHPAGFVLSPKVDRHGYLKVTLWRGGDSRHTQVHRIVAETWCGPCPSTDYEAAHNDGIRTNCAASNIRWATASENAKDRSEHGNWHPARGSSHWKSKLDETKVSDIKRMAAAGVKQVSIGEIFGVSKTTICDILKGRLWTHVT